MRDSYLQPTLHSLRRAFKAFVAASPASSSSSFWTAAVLSRENAAREDSLIRINYITPRRGALPSEDDAAPAAAAARSAAM